MSVSCLLYDGRLCLRLDLAAHTPPADAVLLVPASAGEVAIVTTLAGDRGWLYQLPEDLLRAVHRRQWLEKRGPVYFRPPNCQSFYKADLASPDDERFEN